MITIYDFMGSSPNEIPRDCELKKEFLVERIKILTDVLQSLIEHVAEKEKVQLGVMAQAVPSGTNYCIYELPLEEKPIP